MKRVKMLLTVTVFLFIFIIFGCSTLKGGGSKDRVFELDDDFESYKVGANPSDVYDYWSGTTYRWAPVPSAQPDKYRVATLGGKKVLRYDHSGSSTHFPFASKLYKQKFSQCLKAGVTFKYSEPAMGWGGLLFCYGGQTRYYSIQTMYDNTLCVLSKRSGIIGRINLWSDKNIIEMDHRIEVKRAGDVLTASVIRLDTGKRRSLNVKNTDYTSGRIGFGFDEDTPADVHVNVDDFYAKGTVKAK